MKTPLRALFCAIVMLLTAVNLAAAAPLSATATIQKLMGERAWSTRHAGEKIALSEFHPTWHDEFDSCDIVDDNGKNLGVHNWYAQAGFDLGHAKMAGVSATPPTISCSSGMLKLTLGNGGGEWRGAILRGVDTKLEGHSQQFGYWEARIMLPASVPPGLVPWPSFWFWNRPPNQPPTTAYSEFDLFEAGMISPTDLSAQATTLHQWPAKPAPPTEIQDHLYFQFHEHYAIFDGKWHTYGFLWTPQEYRFYRDGLEVARHPVISGIRQAPMYPLLDIGLTFPPTTTAPNVAYSMYVDYVRSYACNNPSNMCN